MNWVWRDGARLTPAMLHDFVALDAEFYERTGCRLLITDGIRTDEEQIRVFLARYVPVWEVRGRRVYDWAWWNGVQYGRISSLGKVAVPSTSNHQINLARGQKGALDLRDSGTDAGILTRGSRRATIFDEIAPKHGYDSEGYAFGENWHKRYNRDPYRAVPAWSGSPQPAPLPTPKETKVRHHYHRQDHRSRNGGYDLSPGSHFYLNTVKDALADKASNVVGGVGYYSITPHVYATGNPGDQLELVLLWDHVATPGPHSAHYTEVIEFDREGRIQASREFKRQVSAGYAVYVRLFAPATNTGPARVTVFDCDAYLFATA